MVRNYVRKTMDRWSKEDLLQALSQLKKGTLKIHDASQMYGISRATLYRQYKKFVEGGSMMNANQFKTCGGNPILTKVEEDVLENTINELRQKSVKVSSTDIKRICYEYCETNQVPNQFNQMKRMASDDWYYGFVKRHPGVKMHKTSANTGAAEAVSPPVAVKTDNQSDYSLNNNDNQEPPILNSLDGAHTKFAATATLNKKPLKRLAGTGSTKK